MLHIKIQGITKCSSIVANIISADSSLTLPMASLGQNLTILEHGHIEYQIKGYHQIKQQGGKYFAGRPLFALLFGSKVKTQLFQNIVMLHIKLKGNTKCSSIVESILPVDPSLTWGGVIRSKFNFSEHGHDAYQIKGNHQMQPHCSKYFAHRPISNPAVWVKRSKFIFFRTWSCCISNERDSLNVAAWWQIFCLTLGIGQ